MLKIVMFVGTARENSRTRKVADFMSELISTNAELEVSVVDPREMNLSLNDEAMGDKFPDLKKLVAEADAYVIISPEYNHGYPAGLKFVLDLNLKEYFHKPVALVGVSSGPFGGTRVIEHLISIVRELGMVALQKDLQISKARDTFLDSGEVVDREKIERRAAKLIDELVWMTKALKAAREN